MSGWIYILQCSDDSYYTGSTNNLEIRLAQHQNGEGANYTKKRLPVKLVFSQEYDRVDDAFYVEKQVQGWSRKKKQALINGDFEKLTELAKCQNESHFNNKPALAFDSAQAPATSVRKLNAGVSDEIEIIQNKVQSSTLSGVEGHGKNGTNSHNKEAL